MQKNIYLVGGIIGILLLIGIGYSVVKPSEQIGTSAGEGKLEIVEDYYDFGTVGLDNVSHKYRVRNSGDGPLTIAQLSTSCGCTAAQIETTAGASQPFRMDHGNLPPTNVVLAAGEEADIIATYNPLAHGLANAAGQFRRSIYIETDNPRDEHELTFDVTVDPDFVKKASIKFDRTEHQFGQIPKDGGVVETTFTVQNTGSATLNVERIATSCGCTSAEISTESVAAGEQAELTVRFDPDFHEEPQGELERTVTLFTNDPDAPEAEVTIYAEIIE